MITKNDYVLLWAIFNPKMCNAILEKDGTATETILQIEYTNEYDTSTELDIDYVCKENK